MAKHHTVPEFYLQGFVDPASRAERNPWLWVADLHEGTVYRRAPRNVCRVAGFYDSREPGSSLSLEMIYGKIESRTASVIRKLRAHEFDLSQKETYYLACFLGLQISRTKRFRELAKERLPMAARESLHDAIRDPETLKRLLDEYRRTHPNFKATAEQMAQFVMSDRYRIDPTDDALLVSSFELGLDFVPVVGAMAWTFYLTDDMTFYTSDQPVSLLTPDARARSIDFKTWHNPELEVSFPISPSCLLLMHQKTLPEGAFQVSPDVVEWVRHATLPTVHQFVFASKKEDAEWVVERTRR